MATQALSPAVSPSSPPQAPTGRTGQPARKEAGSPGRQVGAGALAGQGGLLCEPRPRPGAQPPLLPVCLPLLPSRCTRAPSVGRGSHGGSGRRVSRGETAAWAPLLLAAQPDQPAPRGAEAQWGPCRTLPADPRAPSCRQGPAPLTQHLAGWVWAEWSGWGGWGGEGSPAADATPTQEQAWGWGSAELSHGGSEPRVSPLTPALRSPSAAGVVTGQPSGRTLASGRTPRPKEARSPKTASPGLGQPLRSGMATPRA